MNFTIKVFPSLADPHNWKWSAQWYDSNDVPRTKVGPGSSENVLSTPLAARQTAERYAKAMAQSLAQASVYDFEVDA
jgi:hypothetical protein